MCIHNPEYECFDCATDRHASEHPAPVDGCRTCKLATVQLDARLHAPRRTRPGTPSSAPRNSWEKGRVTDHRGVPYLVGHDQHHLTVKDYAGTRSAVDARIRELQTSPDPFGGT